MSGATAFILAVSSFGCATGSVSEGPVLTATFADVSTCSAYHSVEFRRDALVTYLAAQNATQGVLSKEFSRQQYIVSNDALEKILSTVRSFELSHLELAVEAPGRPLDYVDEDFVARSPSELADLKRLIAHLTPIDWSSMTTADRTCAYIGPESQLWLRADFRDGQ